MLLRVGGLKQCHWTQTPQSGPCETAVMGPKPSESHNPELVGTKGRIDGNCEAERLSRSPRPRDERV